MTTMTIKKAFKRAALSIAMASLLTAPSFAQLSEAPPIVVPGTPYEAGFDAFIVLWNSTFVPSYDSFVVAVDDQFFAINTYLAEIYAYLQMGMDDGTGIGLIPAIVDGINANNSKIWAEERPILEHNSDANASWNRRNTLEGATGQAILNKMPDPRNCSELTNKVASRAISGGGGGAKYKGQTEATVAKRQAGTSASDVSNAADVIAGHIPAYCTVQDVGYDGSAKEAFGAAHNAFKCTAPGTMPDADARSQSILVPAHDFVKAGAGDAGAIAAAQSLTYDAAGTSTAQSDAADAAISNLVASFSPPALPSNADQTPAGRAYEAKVKVFNDRISPALSALAYIKASRSSVSGWSTGASAATTGSVFANWTSNATAVYANVFPAGTAVPPKPSSSELMRFEVYRRYFDFGANSWINSITTGTPDQVQVQNAETLALNSYLAYQQIQLAEQTNTLLAALLAQSVNPITKQDMLTAAQQATRNN